MAIVTGTAAADLIGPTQANPALRSTNGNDTINGLAGDDRIDAGDGNDLIRGGAGNDVLDGGLGVDIASYFDAPAGVTVTLGLTTPQNTGAGGIDTFISIEGLRGSPFADVLASVVDGEVGGGAGDDRITGSALAFGQRLAGEDGNDTLRAYAFAGELDGGAGNDRLIAGSGIDALFGGTGDDVSSGVGFGDRVLAGDGNDRVGLLLQSGTGLVPTVDGGAGIDVVTALETTRGVSLTLSGSTAFATIAGVEHLQGTNYADQLSGDAAANNLYGAGGDDVLRGGAGADGLNGGAGNDRIEGGDGYDYASYTDATAAIVVSLASSSAQATGGAGSDTLVEIEGVLGSGFADRLSGNAAANVLSGLAGGDQLVGGDGNDRLVGGDGDDVLRGQAGSDVLDGGAGIDVATWSDTSDGVVVTLAVTTAQQVTPGENDRLVDVENVEGSRAADRITGNATANLLDGGAGDDVLAGGGGDDVLIGGDGADLFVIGADGGADLVRDFHDGVDRIAVVGLGPAFDTPDEIVAAASVVAGGIQLALGTGSVVLAGMTLATLDAGDVTTVLV